MHADKMDRKQEYDTRGVVATNASQSIDWYHPGESRVVEVGGVQVTVRFVGRKGRRGRIAITAPAGPTFSHSTNTIQSPD
jgi:hypothetical protein